MPTAHLARSTRREVALDDVQEVAAEVVHVRRHDPDPAVEVVVGHDGGDGGSQPHGRGDECVADVSSHGGNGGLAGGVDLLERPQDAPDRPEQADEGSRGARRGEERGQALERRTLGGGGSAQGAVQVLLGVQAGGHARTVRTAIVPGQAGQLDIGGFEQRRHGAALVALQSVVDLVQALALPEQFEERTVLALRLSQHAGLVEDDDPADDAHDQQDQEHGLDDDIGIQKQLGDSGLRGGRHLAHSGQVDLDNRRHARLQGPRLL